MKTPAKTLLSATVALSVLAGAGVAAAQPYGGYGHDRGAPAYSQGYNQRWDDRGYRQRSRNWRRGGRIDRSDWNRARRVDYRYYNLRQPPRGYEWRRTSTGEVILAAIATGLILDLLTR